MPRAEKSKIILSKNIKLDKSYNNVLDYTTEQMLTMCRENIVTSAENYSFIRHQNTIATNFTYNECLQSNYIAFQNPDYSNKWFFAFIDDVVYVSDKNTTLHYTLDIWSTFFEDWKTNSCFVVREHVEDDTAGLHTIPENLETGDYVVNAHLRENYNSGFESDYYIMIASSIDINKNSAFMGRYNGIPSGIKYYHFNIKDLSGVQDFIKLVESVHEGAIQSLFISPWWLLEPMVDKETYEILNIDVPATKKLGISKITSLDGYTPKNNKLLTFPYCYILHSNNQGSDAVYKQELWEIDNDENSETFGDCVIQMNGCLTQGCSIRSVPLNYNGDEFADNEGINLGKFPVLNWNTDSYINWLTQNGVNIATDLGALGLSLATGNVAPMVAKSAMDSAVTATDFGKAQSNYNKAQDQAINTNLGVASSVGNLMVQNIKAQLVPPQVHGNLNCGDIMMAMDENCFSTYRMTIKKEYAKNIDDYFTRFGYKVNCLKVPNINSRKIFNYIQIADGENVGYGTVQSKFMETINSICRRGVTIWHNYKNIGNYELDNSNK